MPKKDIIFDVIIPTFNRRKLLQRSIESVLAQTHRNFTLHVVDDGSTDDTDELLKAYGDHPQVRLHQQKNSGVSTARNLAAFKGQHDWICFLDSDDEWLPKKLETQAEFINLHPECLFLHSEEIWIRNGVRVNPKGKHKKGNDDIFVRSLDFCLISPSTVAMKRELFLRHHGFDESFTVCEDYDLWLKVLAQNSVGFITTPLIHKYGGHGDQLSTQFVAMDYWRIKSLVRLFKSDLVDGEQKKIILQVVMRKSEGLLRGYLKHQNQRHYDEISNEVRSIMPDVTF